MADATEVKPGTSSKPDSAEDNKESTEAYELLAKGKRDLFCREVPQACQSLQEACRLLAKVYGEVGNECGEAYLSYGAALLDLSRMESGVLGNALKGIASESEEEESVSSDDKVEDPEKVSEQEKEEIGDKVIDAMLETDEEVKAREEKNQTKGDSEGKKGETESDKQGDKEAKKDKTEKKTEDKDVKSDENAAGKDEKATEKDTKKDGKATEDTGKDTKATDKDSEKDAKATEKDSEKDAKATDKDSEKDAKATDKDSEKDAKATDKDSEKDAKATDKDSEKDAKATDKDSEKDAKATEETEKDAKEGNDSKEDKTGKKDEAAQSDDIEMKDEESKKSEEKDCKPEEKKEQDTKADKKDDETEKEETDKDDEESLDTEEDNAEGEENADEEMPEDKEADSSQEDVSNLQLAWEVLELAKMIYSKQEGKESQLKAADACLKLGEVGLETEQYETAINDFQSCLKIQQEFLEPESRLIAETHYQIGLACTFACRYTEAIDNYRLAVKVIESKINLLKSEIEESEKSGKHKELGSFNEVAIQKEKEIKDLSEILPDIRAKLEDTEDEMKSQDKLKEMVKESVTADAATTIGFGNDKSKESPKKSSDAAGPVSDISHMVRKKRKADDDAKEEESSKKPCSEDIKAGGDNATTNGQINGKKPETAETNGKQNGVNGSNGTTSPEKMETEIKTKTVEDVKKASEETA